MTNISGNKSTHLWLRNTEVVQYGLVAQLAVHFIGSEEVMDSSSV